MFPDIEARSRNVRLLRLSDRRIISLPLTTGEGLPLWRRGFTVELWRKTGAVADPSFVVLGLQVNKPKPSI